MEIGGLPSLEIIEGRLYFLVADSAPSDHRYTFFSTDSTLVYTSFFADFGPLDLGLTYSFCEQLQTLLRQEKPVVYYCLNNAHRRANSACLLCAYQIFCLKYTPEKAYKPFIGIQPPLTPFRDASFGINTYPCTVLDCVRAMSTASSLGHFNYETFSLRDFQQLKQLQNGDFSWVIPGKFIAFSGPVETRRELAPNVFSLLPHEYAPILKSLGVTCVVRFNSKCYDRKVFVNAGIRHVDMLYDDGATPPDAILQSFLQLCELESGAIAVHCKAGLGRTGTNIAAYMIKHYGYSARAAIAWCRLCRPGSIVGPQQHYLLAMEDRLRSEGLTFRSRHSETQIQWRQEKDILKNVRYSNDAKGEKKQMSIDTSDDPTEDPSNTSDISLPVVSPTAQLAASVLGLKITAESPKSSLFSRDDAQQQVRLAPIVKTNTAIVPVPSPRAPEEGLASLSIAQVISKGLSSIAHTIKSYGPVGGSAHIPTSPITGAKIFDSADQHSDAQVETLRHKRESESNDLPRTRLFEEKNSTLSIAEAQRPSPVVSAAQLKQVREAESRISGISPRTSFPSWHQQRAENRIRLDAPQPEALPSSQINAPDSNPDYANLSEEKDSSFPDWHQIPDEPPSDNIPDGFERKPRRRRRRTRPQPIVSRSRPSSTSPSNAILGQSIDT